MDNFFFDFKCLSNTREDLPTPATSVIMPVFENNRMQGVPDGTVHVDIWRLVLL